MTITEFLEARIAEDEKRAAYYGPLTLGMRRLLAECAAKRAIIAIHHPHNHGGTHGDAVFCDECQWDHADDTPRIDNQPVENFGANPCRTLVALAAVYKDHPDYQQEWAA